MKAMKVIFAICTGLIMAACGGGGDGSSSAPANFSGTWSTNLGGTSYVYLITQNGSSLNLTRTTPPLAGLTSTGVVSGNTASVISYINNVQITTSTFTLTSANTGSLTANTCTPPAGYSCAAPGTTLILTR